jgi:hypothetical protein
MSETTNLWRVDVAGYPIDVRGEDERDYLQQVNSQLARMKMALHRIAKMDPSVPVEHFGDVAREALKNV